ncbi:hypothetical protein, partial [Streptomyces sp. NEAU-W12]|uniref:hypothetical protein n=1 Tax=Streptomyces sp. NEAU-W12 TaxID=2994668 RepID=UPI00224A75AF
PRSSFPRATLAPSHTSKNSAIAGGKSIAIRNSTPHATLLLNMLQRRILRLLHRQRLTPKSGT